MRDAIHEHVRLFLVREQLREGFGMLLAALFLAGRIGDDALRFGLADPLAGIGFDGLHGGEGPLFGAFLRHMEVFSGIPAHLPDRVQSITDAVLRYEILAGE